MAFINKSSYVHTLAEFNRNIRLKCLSWYVILNTLGQKQHWIEKMSAHNWWVNHKQTYNQEVKGGYIWSPKLKADGAENHFYDNMKRVIPGDLVFSYANGRIQDVGVATSFAKDAPKPDEFGKAGKSWSSHGWLVMVSFMKTNSAISPKRHIEAIKPLLPSKYSPIQKNGNGNQGAYLASVSSHLSDKLLSLINDKRLAGKIEKVRANLDRDRMDEDENEEGDVWSRTDISPTEKHQLVLARRGQGKFRKELEKIERACRLTNITDRRHLRASHIKPWRKCSDLERLDGNNGLLLAPHYDHLFDRGYVTFSDSGNIEISKQLEHSLMIAFNLSGDENVGCFNSRQRAYLAYHRTTIFRK